MNCQLIIVYKNDSQKKQMFKLVLKYDILDMNRNNKMKYLQ